MSPNRSPGGPAARLIACSKSYNSRSRCDFDPFQTLPHRHDILHLSWLGIHAAALTHSGMAPKIAAAQGPLAWCGGPAFSIPPEELEILWLPAPQNRGSATWTTMIRLEGPSSIRCLPN